MRKWIIGLALLALPAAGCTDQENSGGKNTASPGSSAAAQTSASPSPASTANPGTPAASAAVTSTPKTSPTAKSSPAAAASPSAQPGVLAPAAAKGVIEARAREAIQALKSKDWATLEKLAHPDAGLRLSPYCYVDTKKDIVFPKGQIAKLAADNTAKVWGSYDGSGEPIQLTFAQFYDKFLYNHDYAKPEKTGYNESWGKSNTKNNLRDVYPDSILVEYYFSGFDAKLEGHDWASLSLVFEKKGDTWYLSGLVHNQWTI